MQYRNVCEILIKKIFSNLFICDRMILSVLFGTPSCCLDGVETIGIKERK